MTPGIMVFLVGLFGVPLGLLWFGHRLRRRPPRTQRAFWGATIGHCIAALLALPASMIPPEAWGGDDTVRGFLGLWTLLALPLIGMLAGWGLGGRGRR